MSGDLPPGSVTTADLYRVLVDMQGTMSKLAAHIERIDGRNEMADRSHLDFETRIRMLEQFKYKLMGASGLTGILCGIGGALLEAWLSRH